jgi:hypothetical protein
VALLGCGGAPSVEDAGRDAGPEHDAPPALDAHLALDAAPDVGTDAQALDASSPSTPWFEDVTESWGVRFVRDGADDYLTLTDRMGGGVCPIDVDGRAPLDLFFAMRPTATSRSRLYVASQPGGAGSDVSYGEETDARGLASVGDALACLAFDADADGDEDLLTMGVGTVQLFVNDGGLFAEATERLGLTLDPIDVYVSASAGDVDHDGDVDLYVAGFMRFDTSDIVEGERCGTIPCVSSLYEFGGIPDFLLLREPDGSYRDATASLAPDLRRDEMTFVTGILRMTGRGPVDLWVGNDLGARYRDRVLRWSDALARYEDVGIELGLATNARGYGVDTMGWSQGDLDGDGELDFVASSWPGDTTAAYFCAPLPEGGELCEDRGRLVGLSLGVGAFRWGVGLGDLDLDGDLDLMEATGHLYAQEDLRRTADELQAPTLYENTGAGMLALRAFPEGDALSVRATLRGLSLVDLDDDGRLDVVMAPARGAPRILRNVREPAGHFVRIALAGQSGGARLSITWSGGPPRARTPHRRRLHGQLRPARARGPAHRSGARGRRGRVAVRRGEPRARRERRWRDRDRRALDLGRAGPWGGALRSASGRGVLSFATTPPHGPHAPKTAVELGLAGPGRDCQAVELDLGRAGPWGGALRSASGRGVLSFATTPPHGPHAPKIAVELDLQAAGPWTAGPWSSSPWSTEPCPLHGPGRRGRSAQSTWSPWAVRSIELVAVGGTDGDEDLREVLEHELAAAEHVEGLEDLTTQLGQAAEVAIGEAIGEQARTAVEAHALAAAELALDLDELATTRAQRHLGRVERRAAPHDVLEDLHVRAAVEERAALDLREAHARAHREEHVDGAVSMHLGGHDTADGTELVELAVVAARILSGHDLGEHQLAHALRVLLVADEVLRHRAVARLEEVERHLRAGQRDEPRQWEDRQWVGRRSSQVGRRGFSRVGRGFVGHHLSWAAAMSSR